MTDEEQKKIFSENLRYYIEQKGITQLELADAIGEKKNTVNTWVKERSIPTVRKIQKLADYFDIDKSDLTDKPQSKIKDNQINVVAANINHLLDIKGLKQIDLANAIDEKKTTVNSWCHARNTPPVNKIQKMAEFFNVTMSDIIEPNIESTNINQSITNKELLDIMNMFIELSPEQQKTIKDLIITLHKTI